MAAERVSSLGEDGSARDGAEVRSPVSLNAPEQLMGRCVPTVRKSQGAAGEERDAEVDSKMHRQPPPCPAVWQGTNAAWTSPWHLQCPPQPWTPRVSALLHVVLLENWSSGTALSLVEQCVGGETSSYSEEEEPWTRACLPLGPPALHGTCQGQLLSLNSPNYLCWGNPRDWGDKSISHPRDRIATLEKLGRDRLAGVCVLPCSSSAPPESGHCLELSPARVAGGEWQPLGSLTGRRPGPPTPEE